jgi:tRNA(Ser,Leu) C12 N-acetylase TAN1
MAEKPEQQVGKLLITSRGFEPVRHLRFALKAAIPGARVRSAGFKGIFIVETNGEVPELAKSLYQECAEQIGHLTVILATVESSKEPIQEAAVQVAATQIGPEESFSFRLHKRGEHRLAQDTSAIEREIGGAIWTALKNKYGKEPKVNLKNPDVTVVAEMLGPTTAVGVSRRAWRERIGDH